MSKASPQSTRIAIASLLAATALLPAGAIGAHVWEKQELTFTAARTFTNAYTEAVVWVDLTGPNFKKRVYGFWDGGQTFRVRLLATEPGTWTWRSGSSPADDGLAGKSGSFEAVALERSGESRRTPCAEVFCGRPPITTPSSTPMGPRSSPSATPGGRWAQIGSAGTTTTRSARSGRRPGSRITFVTAKRKASTGST